MSFIRTGSRGSSEIDSEELFLSATLLYATLELISQMTESPFLSKRVLQDDAYPSLLHSSQNPVYGPRTN